MATIDENEEDGLYFFDSDEPVQVQHDPEYDYLKVEIAALLQQQFPGRFFSRPVIISETNAGSLPGLSVTGKLVFEIVTLGNKVLKKMAGGMIRFFETDQDQIACTINSLTYDEESDSHAGDIVNLLFDRDGKQLKLCRYDFLVESKYL